MDSGPAADAATPWRSGRIQSSKWEGYACRDSSKPVRCDFRPGGVNHFTDGAANMAKYWGPEEAAITS